MRVKVDKHPKVFLSYSWDDVSHRQWVLAFASRLRKDGVDVTLDQWHLQPGDRLPVFMEQIDQSDFVLILCTPNYKEKSDGRKGGVGYEGDIITADLFIQANHRKYIPLLRQGEWGESAPVWAKAKLYLDFRGDPYLEASYEVLLDTVFGTLEGIPVIGNSVLGKKKRRLNLLKDLKPQDETV